jgi:hypothetical protein
MESEIPCVGAMDRPSAVGIVSGPDLSAEIGAAAPSGGLDQVGFSQEARAARPVRGGLSRLVARAWLLCGTTYRRAHLGVGWVATRRPRPAWVCPACCRETGMVPGQPVPPLVGR